MHCVFLRLYNTFCELLQTDLFVGIPIASSLSRVILNSTLRKLGIITIIPQLRTNNSIAIMPNDFLPLRDVVEFHSCHNYSAEAKTKLFFNFRKTNTTHC
jgi:hypothetical protein